MIPVKALYEECEKMLKDGWGYIWGTAGIKWTQARQDEVSDSNAKKYGKKWIGHIVADCSGVMVYIWKQHGMSIYHGSNSIARKFCGIMQDTPVAGYAAFKWKKKILLSSLTGVEIFTILGSLAEMVRQYTNPAVRRKVLLLVQRLSGIASHLLMM